MGTFTIGRRRLLAVASAALAAAVASTTAKTDAATAPGAATTTGAASRFGASLGATLVETYVQALNTRNFDLLARVISPGYYEHDQNRGTGRAGLIEYFTAATKYAPDFKAEIVQLVAEPDAVAAVIRYTGTNYRGNYSETLPVEFWHIEKGLLAEHWDGGK